MNLRSLLALLCFIVISFSCGWMVRGLVSDYRASESVVAEVSGQKNTIDSQIIADNKQLTLSEEHPKTDFLIPNKPSSNENKILANPKSNGTTTFILFDKLLGAHRYSEAMDLYQAQYNEQVIFKLRGVLLDHLEHLLRAQDQNNFSDLTNAFLAIYYDDIDVLLLLAKFNNANGLYMEAVNIYQLAKSYAYSNTQQQKVIQSFNQFVERVDRFYAEKKDWFSLINLYTHIDATGLLSSHYQYRQAIIYHKSGDDYSAIEQLERLENDSLVGNQATATLNQLVGNNVQPTNPWQGAERVSLQRRGNQYLVDLGLNRRDKVTLLIDTGASMTTLSRSSFQSLNSNRQAVEVGQRVFQTANGVVKGTVYSMPQLNLGPFSMRNIQVAVLDFTMSSGVDGLLGMNVLGQFRFQIDQDDVSLYLNKK